jgi:hypothetical protein
MTTKDQMMQSYNFEIGSRKVVIGILFVTAVLVFSSGVGAVEEKWKYYGSDQKGNRFFYNDATVLRMSPDLIQVWTRELTAEGPVKRLEEINCAYKIVRDSQVIYEGKQRPRVPPRLPSAWRAMELDPITKELHKMLCR